MAARRSCSTPSPSSCRTTGAALLAGDAAAKDFVTDAFAHCKFIGYSAAALALFEKAGLAADMDDGCIQIGSSRDAGAFVGKCGALRHWDREMKVDLDAKGGEATKKRPR